MIVIGRVADPEHHSSALPRGGSFFQDEKQIHLAAALAVRLACQGSSQGALQDRRGFALRRPGKDRVRVWLNDKKNKDI